MRGVALVERQVDHLEDGIQPADQVIVGRQLERDAILAQRAFRADDALGDGALAAQEGAGDFGGT